MLQSGLEALLSIASMPLYNNMLGSRELEIADGVFEMQTLQESDRGCDSILLTMLSLRGPLRFTIKAALMGL